MKLPETQHRHVLSNKPRGIQAAVPEPAIKTGITSPFPQTASPVLKMAGGSSPYTIF